MSSKPAKIIYYITLAVLLIIGIFLILKGDTGFGSGLIGGAVGVFIIKSIQHKRIDKMEAEGKTPYDERSYYLSAKSALTAIRIFIIILAALVIGGSVFGPPELMVNPWDTLGITLALLVFLWLGFYYYYNKIE